MGRMAENAIDSLHFLWEKWKKMKKNLQKRKEVIQWVGSQAMHRDHGTKSDTFLRAYYKNPFLFFLWLPLSTISSRPLCLGMTLQRNPLRRRRETKTKLQKKNNFYPLLFLYDHFLFRRVGLYGSRCKSHRYSGRSQRSLNISRFYS